MRLPMATVTRASRRYSIALSTGQQQRVALARSMAPAPRLLLLDEPFSNLDAARRQETREEVRSLLKRHEMSALLVTHDQEEALSFADRLGVMQAGRLLQAGTPEEVYHRPGDAFVARFLGGANLLAADARGCEAWTALGALRLDRAATGHVRVSVRPEHLALKGATPDRPTAEVVDRAFKGHDLSLRVACNGQDVVVQTMYDCPFHVGDRVSVTQRAAAVVIDGSARPCPPPTEAPRRSPLSPPAGLEGVVPRTGGSSLRRKRARLGQTRVAGVDRTQGVFGLTARARGLSLASRSGSLPMRSTQPKALALIVAQVAALVATPETVVLCEGPGGHLAVAPVHASHASTVSYQRPATGVPTDSGRSAGRCRDTLLSATNPVRLESLGTAPLPVNKSVPIGWMDPFATSSPPSRRLSRAETSPHPSARPTRLLRTVVLQT